MKNVALALAIFVFLAFCVMLTAQIMVSVDLPQTGQELKGDHRFDFAALAPIGTTPLPTIQNFTARDNSLLGYRLYRSGMPTHIKLYLVHSAAWQAMEFNQIASRLATERGVADVYLADMRGHGSGPARRGDVDYVGQLEDDLADLISETAGPGDLVVVGGHGEGAAVAMQFALDKPQAVHGCLVLAPVLSYNLSGNKPDLGGWTHALGTRMVGLWILNGMGLHWSDHETVLQYALPSTLRDGPLGYSATTDISWRMYHALQMRDRDGRDVGNLAMPLLSIIGGGDEVVDAEAMTAMLKSRLPNGQYWINPAETHINVVVSNKTLAIIQDWLSELH